MGFVMRFVVICVFVPLAILARIGMWLLCNPITYMFGIAIGLTSLTLFSAAYYALYYALTYYLGPLRLPLLYFLCALHLGLWAYLTARWVHRKWLYGFDSPQSGLIDGLVEDWMKPTMVYIAAPHYEFLSIPQNKKYGLE